MPLEQCQDNATNRLVYVEITHAGEKAVSVCV